MPDYDALATEFARQLRPDLDAAAGPGAVRSHRAFVRMLSVVLECNDLRNAGCRNAATAIAERRSMSHSTVTMLLHRARTTYGITVVAQPSTANVLADLADRWEQMADQGDAAIGQFEGPAAATLDAEVGERGRTYRKAASDVRDVLRTGRIPHDLMTSAELGG
ncbi:hypothetical protein [Streptomyces sp. NBC_01614]|uniref:hypothetical protein n=1 Tax=Streptomyces sp. NBC_01614 TaxID=2975897 RepID=UPI0038682AC4